MLNILSLLPSVNQTLHFVLESAIDKELQASNKSLSKEVTKRVSLVQSSSVPLLTGKQFSPKNSDSPLNALMVLTGETSLIENYGAYWKVFINLRGEALLFDYKKKSVIKTIPLNLKIFDATPGGNRPTTEQISKLVKNAILTNDEQGLISQFVSKISTVEIGNKSDKIFQIGNVEISSDAMSLFPQEIKSNPQVAGQIVADILASNLSSYTAISLMPTKLNSAIGVMSFQLEDIGDQIELKVGDGDYIFNVSLTKIIKRKTQETPSEIQTLYGIYSNIKVIEPIGETLYLDALFKNGEFSISPVTKVTVDDYPAYYDTLNALFRKFSEAIKSKNFEWVKASTGTEKFNDSISRVSDLIHTKGK